MERYKDYNSSNYSKISLKKVKDQLKMNMTMFDQHPEKDGNKFL